MLTGAYLNNRTPHAALNNETPYKRLYGKDATLGHFRTIGARAFVHVETRGRKLDLPGKGGSWGTTWIARRTGFTTQRQGL